MTDELKHLMTRLADEVKPTSLHEAATRRSRQASRRNTGLAAVAALALAGGTVVGLNGLAFGDSSDPAPAASAGTQLDGVFYETSAETDEAIRQWTSESPQPVPVAPGGPENRYTATAKVSPDGRYISYVTVDTDDDPGYSGRLMVLDVQSAEHVQLSEYDWELRICSVPTWSPDGRLFVDHGGDGEDRYGFYDLETDTFTASVDPRGCEVQVAEDGNGDDLFIAVEHLGGDTQDLNVTTAQGTTTKSPIKEILRKTRSNLSNLTAVSPDGEYACLRVGEGMSGNFTEQVRTCDYIIEIATGTLIMTTSEATEGQLASRSPGGIASVNAFAVPDHILVTLPDGNGYQLVDFSGEVVATVESQSTVANPLLVGYVPA